MSSRSNERNWAVPIAFFLALTFNLVVGGTKPLQVTLFLEKFKLIEKGCPKSQVTKVLGANPSIKENVGYNSSVERYFIPTYVFDTDTYAIIYYEDGVVEKKESPEVAVGESSSAVFLSFMTGSFYLTLILLILFGVDRMVSNKRNDKVGILGYIAYATVFMISVFNLLFLVCRLL